MKKSMFDYRGRVQFATTVNDNTKAVIRREVSFFAKDQKDNAQLAAYSTIGAKDKQGNDVAEYYRAELNYKF